MFKDKKFTIAFSISLLWHLFWMCIVFVVIVPKGMDFVKFPTVSFLGPVLEQDSVTVQEQNSDINRFSTFFKKDFEPLDIPKVEVDIPEKFQPDDVEKIDMPINELFADAKLEAKPEILEESIEYDFKTPVEAGPLQQRRILEKGSLPNYNKWAVKEARGFNIRFKLWVSPQGKVVKIERLTSSGVPQVDVLGISYLQQWRFEDISPFFDQAQWGVVELDFK